MLNRISIQISDECVDAYAVQAIPVIIPVLYFAGELIRDGSSYSLCAPIRSSPLLRETAVREGASAVLLHRQARGSRLPNPGYAILEANLRKTEDNPWRSGCRWSRK